MGFEKDPNASALYARHLLASLPQRTARALTERVAEWIDEQGRPVDRDKVAEIVAIVAEYGIERLAWFVHVDDEFAFDIGPLLAIAYEPAPSEEDLHERSKEHAMPDDPMTPEELDEGLAAAPWLRPYCRVGDVDLEAARARFATDQKAGLRVLKRNRIDVPIRVTTDRGLKTTSYDSEHVNVTSER